MLVIANSDAAAEVGHCREEEEEEEVSGLNCN